MNSPEKLSSAGTTPNKQVRGADRPSDHRGWPPEQPWLKVRTGVAKSPDTCGSHAGIYNFNIIDNLVQQSNSEEFKKQTQLDIKNFQFEPSWVKITPDNITVGYVGIYVNADFSLTFSNINDKWVLEK